MAHLLSNTIIPSYPAINSGRVVPVLYLYPCQPLGCHMAPIPVEKHDHQESHVISLVAKEFCVLTVEPGR